MAQSMTASEFVINVDEANFQQEVVQRSRQTPVVVDFWAAWCGPCRTLSPTLEGLAREHGGKFILAKVDVDANQDLAMRFGVQGIPAVKAFRDGRLVDEFVGAQPAPMVRQFVQRLIPTEADRKVSQGLTLLDEQKAAEAEVVFHEALADDANHGGALLGLARALLAQGQTEPAAEALARVPLGTPEGNEAARLQKELALRVETEGADEVNLRERLAADPADLETRYTLAALLAVNQCYDEALENYLEVVRRNRKFRDGAAREAMLHIFDTLGDDPLVRTYRSKLASALFV
jgi:putative thioredoxin